MSSLKDLALKLLENGPHRVEHTPRRVRGLFDGVYIFDTTEARYVWEHQFYPQFYVLKTTLNAGSLIKNDAVDEEGSAFLATLRGKSKSTDRVISFERGPLTGLVRLEFGVLDAWFEEDQQIYGPHPKDPYNRVEILPSSRKITAKVDGVVIAESRSNMFLYETLLRPRYYMPLTSVNWLYLSPSDNTTVCPYKGVANYYNVIVNGQEHKDLVWWYKYPSSESAQIAGHMCCYNEKVQILIDDVEEQQ